MEPTSPWRSCWESQPRIPQKDRSAPRFWVRRPGSPGRKRRAGNDVGEDEQQHDPLADEEGIARLRPHGARLLGGCVVRNQYRQIDDHTPDGPYDASGQDAPEYAATVNNSHNTTSCEQILSHTNKPQLNCLS